MVMKVIIFIFLCFKTINYILNSDYLLSKYNEQYNESYFYYILFYLVLFKKFRYFKTIFI